MLANAGALVRFGETAGEARRALAAIDEIAAAVADEAAFGARVVAITRRAAGAVAALVRRFGAADLAGAAHAAVDRAAAAVADGAALGADIVAVERVATVTTVRLTVHD